MATWIRRIVSGQKKRFQNEEFDLDLAYISPRIIAMGLPAQGKDVLYRNPLPEIARFLQTYHRGRAKVYNLCSEYTYSAEKLSVALQHYPFDDHQTPALLVVQQFCADAADWLAQHPHNVVVVHCKAGKGRTGLMICSLLMYLHKNAPGLANVPAAGSGADTDTSAASSAATTKDRTSSGNILKTAADLAVVVTPPDVLAATAAASPFASKGLKHSNSGVISNGRLSRTNSSSDNRELPAVSALYKSQSLPLKANSSGWHPWQHVEPVELLELSRPVKDVLALYAARRTHDGNGVTIPSQRRYVGYFWHVLTAGPQPCGILPTSRVLQLRQLIISGLPAGAADSCSVLVEARPSGSTAASPTRVWLCPARRTSSSTVPGLQLCMGPCSVTPQVQDDGCTVVVNPAGDSLTIQLPAASLGLSLLSHDPAGTAPAVTAAAASVQVKNYMQPTAAASEQELQSPFAAAAAVMAGRSSSRSSLGKRSAAADSCSISELGELSGCCVVEGDVRISVLRGGSKLFFAWFNTALVPDGGSFTLARVHLDKVAKNLPGRLSVTVNYMDMQPQAGFEAEVEVAAAIGGEQQKQLQHSADPGGRTASQAGANISGNISKAVPVAPMTLPNSSGGGSLTVADCSNNLLLLGSSMSAPASPQASMTARATTWLQLPALPSLGSLPLPLQWPGSNSSSKEVAEQQADDVVGLGFSSVPAADSTKNRRDRRSAGKGKHRAGNRAGRRAQCDSSGMHFWDWNWASLAAAAAGAGAEDVAAADVAAARWKGQLHQPLQASTVGAQVGTKQWQSAAADAWRRHQQHTSKALGTSAAGIELHAFSRSVDSAAEVAVMLPPVNRGKAQTQQQHQQQWMNLLTEDEDDGGDVFATDVYGRPDSLDILLRASSPTAATGAVLGAHDPLQGLLEAWHSSLDTRHNRRQQQRWWSLCSSSSSNSSRASSPGLDITAGPSLLRVNSCPTAPPTPGRIGRSSTTGPSLGSKTGLGTAVGANQTVAAFAAGAAGKDTRCMAGTAAAAEAAVAPVTPSPTVPLMSAHVAAGELTAVQVPDAAAVPGCLECLYNMHTGSCPLSAPGMVAAVLKHRVPMPAGLPQPAFAGHYLSGAVSAAAPTTTPVVGSSIRRTASTPDSKMAAAVAAAASCTVTLMDNTVAATASADAAGLVGSASAALEAVVASGELSDGIDVPCKAAAAAGAAPGGVGKGQAARRHSMDVSSATKGIIVNRQAVGVNVARRSPTGDLTTYSTCSCSSTGDDQRQGLLQYNQQPSSSAAAGEGADRQRTGAGLVQQWQQLERAWQRNWL